MKDWSRYKEAKRLHKSGLSMKAVGESMGVSGGRVQQMIATLDRRERMLARGMPDSPPRQWWFDLKAKTARSLIAAGFDSRVSCLALTSDTLQMWRGSIALPGWENDKSDWYFSRRKLSLAQVNEVRAWLGCAPYVPPPRGATPAEIDRARRLLESNGWRVEPPTPPSSPAPARAPSPALPATSGPRP